MKPFKSILVSLIFLLTLPIGSGLAQTLAERDLEIMVFSAIANNQFDEACSLAKKAAIDGSASIQLILGMFYQEGLGVGCEKNGRTAFKWIHTAAEAQDTMAMLKVGVYYREGFGVKADGDIAHKWFGRAAPEIKRMAAKGHALFQAILGELFLDGLIDGGGRENALFWFQKSANQGDVQAAYKLGVVGLEEPLGSTEYEAATGWLTKAAQRSHVLAQDVLGQHLTDRTRSSQEKAQGIEWLRESARQGYKPAQAKLGRALLNEGNNTSSLEDAFFWWRLSGEKVPQAVAGRLGPSQITAIEKRLSNWRSTEKFDRKTILLESNPFRVR